MYGFNLSGSPIAGDVNVGQPAQLNAPVDGVEGNGSLFFRPRAEAQSIPVANGGQANGSPFFMPPTQPTGAIRIPIAFSSRLTQGTGNPAVHAEGDDLAGPDFSSSQLLGGAQQGSASTKRRAEDDGRDEHGKKGKAADDSAHASPPGVELVCSNTVGAGNGFCLAGPVRIKTKPSKVAVCASADT
ncbi:hypothetical protein DFH09DRAFT_1081217 [Mycena vulgaris]|nr:hypothetical protein DFH09DRAFT_1081217 [Mycena vulgaris]